MKSVNIWKKQLSQTEVAHSSSISENCISGDYLMACYDFEEGSNPSILEDRTGNLNGELKNFNTDGSSWIACNATGIEEASKYFRLYPNPATDQISLEIGEVQMASMKLFDGNGRLVENFSLFSKNQLDISHLRNKA